MSFDFTAYPTVGKFPLDVKISNITTPTVSYSSSITSAGYTGLANGVTSAGFSSKPYTPVISWDFGDGQTSTKEGDQTHRYSTPGTYKLRGELRDTETNSTTQVEKNIKVLDFVLENLGIIDSEDKFCLNYGHSIEEGFNWSTDSGEKMVWVETKASAIYMYDENSDFTFLAFDSETGLPYVLNPKAKNSKSNIKDSWLDKLDPLKDGSGFPITSTFTLQELIGSSEAFMQKMSDINLFFLPYDTKDQGQIGYNVDGFIDGTKFNLDLYVDDKVSSKDSISDAPLKRELYFDKGIQGHIFQVGIQVTESKYKFLEGQFTLLDYDKALYPFQEEQTETKYQNELDNLFFWATRGSKKDRVQGLLLDVSLIPGVDGYSTSGFKANSNISIQNTSTNTVTFLFWSTTKNDIDYTIVETYEVGGKTWYLHKKVGILGIPIQLSTNVEFFDIRIIEGNVSDEAIMYYIKDIESNQGDSVCPVFS